MKKTLLFVALCCMSMLAFAEAGPICGETLRCEQTSPACPDPDVYVKWETDAVGNVDITVYKDAMTAWRGRGMADDLSAAAGWSMTIDGTAAVLADYFDKNYTASANQSTAPTVYQLKIKDGKKADLDSHVVVIKIVPAKNICWWNALDNNGWGKHTFEYLYGSVCEGIAEPTNVAVTPEGVVTFTGVPGATGYTATISMEGAVLTSQTVVSGDTLTRPFRSAATVQVAVVATSSDGNSDPSEPVDWQLAANPIAAADMPGSAYCAAEIGNGTSLAYQTWGVNAHGDVVISISGDGATWRGTAFKGIANFKVGTAPASLFFTEEYITGSTEYMLKLKDGMSIAEGEEITFKGTAQWLTAQNANCYQQNMVLTYVYGSSCPQVATPTINGIDATKHITITSEDASSFIVRILKGDDLYYVKSGIVSGDSLDFPVLAAGPYSVVAVGQAAGTVDSEESAAYEWNPTVETPVLGTSELCGTESVFTSDTYNNGPTNTEDSRVSLMVNTNHGRIEVSIVTVADMTATFRTTETAGGLMLAGFYVNGAPASQFFTLSETAEMVTLTPIEEHTLPFGMKVNYIGKMQWATPNYPNAYGNSIRFAHVYGTTCSDDIDPNPSVSDALETIETGAAARKVIVDGHLYILTAEGMYNASGMKLKQEN